MKPAKSRRQLELIATALAVHVERWPWRQLVASDHGPRFATTRYVLQVIALFMSDAGGSCYPSQSAIARRAGLTTRAVKKHIAIAKRAHWLDVSEYRRVSISHSWRGNSYAATVPAELHPLVQRLKNGDTRVLWINSDRGERGSPSWGTTFPQSVNYVPIESDSTDSTVLSKVAVGKSATRASRSRAPDRSTKDDLKNRSEKGSALRARIGGATQVVPTKDRPHALTDSELAAKVRKLRAVVEHDGDIRRALASQASAAQLTRVLKSIAR